MQRRFRYALTAGVLSSGAPAGLLGIRLVQAAANGEDDDAVQKELTVARAAYLYVGGATALIFSAFGYVLGRQADRLAAFFGNRIRSPNSSTPVDFRLGCSPRRSGHAATTSRSVCSFSMSMD